ncbi:YdcF family protein [Symbioplanes lichenis]|uniref:YdcF family protein n=1 Tax=Symbioplanes lichenis TaxID=1629072 RepID=UPI0027394B31|nr:ElyC/SanA/YdcF family protein [Actinoplanes lichenis]
MLNTLAAFLGRRDVPSLPPADVLVLFGGCPPPGWDLVGSFLKSGDVRHVILVGGAGHTTPMLRAAVARRYPELAAAPTEADIMAAYLASVHGITGCLLERSSANCGNNVTFAERVLRDEGITPSRMILVQDAAMQQRMDAVTRHVWTLGTPEVINFAGTQPRFAGAAYASTPHWGAWDIEHCITLLMGEVPRLIEYPARGFQAPTDIPSSVLSAYEQLLPIYGGRPAMESRPAGG